MKTFTFLMLLIGTMQSHARPPVLGQATLISRNFQGLLAEIDFDPGTRNLNDVRIVIASKEVFQRFKLSNHIKYEELVRLIKLKLVKKSDNQYYIQVFAREKFPDLTLSIMIDVVWENGLVRKEFFIKLEYAPV